MIKNSIKFILIVLLSNLLILSNSFSFHKGKSEKPKEIIINPDDDKKKLVEKQKKNYCSQKVVSKTSKKTEEEKDENFEPKNYLEIDSYHTPTSINIGGKKLYVASVNLNFEEHRYNSGINNKSLRDILNFFCLQDGSKERPEKFKGSYLEKFYKDIAKDNGIINQSGEGNFNKKIKDELYDVIAKEGILIKNPNAVYYLPDQYIAKYDKFRLKKEKKKKDDEQTAATKKGNEQWISENSQDWIDKITSKLNEFDKEIDGVKQSQSKTLSLYNDYKNEFLRLSEKTDEIFEDVDVTKKEVKNKRREIREQEKKVLKESELKTVEANFKKVKKLKFDGYNNYKELKSIKKDAEKAKKNNKASKFLGRKETSISIGGFKISLSGSKIGIIERFENLENKDLGKKFEIDKEKVEDLKENLEKKIKSLNEYENQLEELVNLDDDLDNQLPIVPILIGLLVLAVISGVGFYIYSNNRKLKQLQEDADKKVGSLKSDLEGRLKDTSEQIKSVGRVAARSGQTGTLSQDQIIDEKPKSPEEIIAAKYDELVSDYKEALDDFSKVAKFKQKWNGLALNRKERQDGSKTALISSPRAFEKAEIWCVTFSDKYFAFPGSTVKSNMAIYMNFDFQKADADFKGVFSVTAGSTYISEPAVIRKGGAGFVVERPGKIIFPD